MSQRTVVGKDEATGAPQSPAAVHQSPLGVIIMCRVLNIHEASGVISTVDDDLRRTPT